VRGTEMQMELKLAKPAAGTQRHTAYVFDGSRALFPFTFPIMATVGEIEAACKSQAAIRKIRIAFSASDFARAYQQAQANQPTPAQPVAISLNEQRRKLVWAINDAEQAILEAREAAFQRDLGGIPTESTTLASARKALAEFDAAHPQAEPANEALWNL